MNRRWFKLAFTVAAAVLLPSCGADKRLISIDVEPENVIFEGVGAAVQFKATGHYIHPPISQDITDQVQWSIDVKYLATITSGGLATATSVCGNGNAIATVYSHPGDPPSGTVVTGSAHIAGIDDGTPTCQ